MEAYFRKIMAVAVVMVGLALTLSAIRPERVTGSPLQQDELVAHGEYIATITRCISCHTPDQAEYLAETLTEDQTRTLALSPRDALDLSKWMSGGRVFNFGPSGSVTASNITPDEETGIGSWTDEELKNTLLTGVTPSGRRMHTIMPVLTNLAESDIDAVIAYLRSLEPIANAVVNELEVTAPPAELPEDTVIAPDASDQSARGAYLVNNMNCSGCHTPTDPETRRPIMEKYLAGRDPFQRDYGTVYAGNVTPHEETGIGTWSDEEIARAITEGVRKDGRRLSLMPWQDYAALNEADINAMVFYLTNDVPAVENTIPQTDLQEPYRVFVDGVGEEEAEEEGSNTMMLAAAVVVGLLLAAGAVLLVRRKPAAAA